MFSLQIRLSACKYYSWQINLQLAICAQCPCAENKCISCGSNFCFQVSFVFWPLVISAGGNLVCPEWVVQGVDDIFVAVTASYLAIFFLVEMDGSQRTLQLSLFNRGPPL